nr:MAG TPA: Transcription intermediary factor 1-beta [Caudoviricetes sp.]
MSVCFQLKRTFILPCLHPICTVYRICYRCKRF